MIVESTNVENMHQSPAFAKPLLPAVVGSQTKYQIVYADPAWDFKGGGIYQDNGRKDRSISSQYKLTKTNDMAKLPIKDITDTDAFLFMWCTDSHLKQGIELMEAWGFRYSTIAFIWVKQYASGSLCSNVGRWTMKNCEIVLLGLKGTPLKYKKAKNIKQLVMAERTGHSVKPDEVRNRISQLCGDLPRIELFARIKTDGWDVFGNEVNNSIDLERYRSTCS